MPHNEYEPGVARTIKASPSGLSAANLKRTDGYACTGVEVVVENEKLN